MENVYHLNDLIPYDIQTGPDLAHSLPRDGVGPRWHRLEVNKLHDYRLRT